LQPLATDKMPIDLPPPRSTRFGSPLVLSRVHWVRPELVAEVRFLTWTEDDLLRQVVYDGLREDKPPREVRREVRTRRHDSIRSIRKLVARVTDPRHAGRYPPTGSWRPILTGELLPEQRFQMRDNQGRQIGLGRDIRPSA
jgi:hypothetical protein